MLCGGRRVARGESARGRPSVPCGIFVVFFGSPAAAIPGCMLARMSWRDIPAKHPIWWAIGSVGVISVPQWFSAVWALFSPQPAVPTIWGALRRIGITLPAFSAYWITVPLGCLMFGWLMLELKKQKRPRPAQHSTPVPDWPIRELFFYLRSELRTAGPNASLATVGMQVKDKLSTGQLKAWGRRTPRSPFEVIDVDYWQHSDFEEWPVWDDEAWEITPSTTRPAPHTGLLEYFQVHVNKAQAVQLFQSASVRPS